jgi:hypothetical protein
MRKLIAFIISTKQKMPQKKILQELLIPVDGHKHTTTSEATVEAPFIENTHTKWMEHL